MLVTSKKPVTGFRWVFVAAGWALCGLASAEPWTLAAAASDIQAVVLSRPGQKPLRLRVDDGTVDAAWRLQRVSGDQAVFRWDQRYHGEEYTVSVRLGERIDFHQLAESLGKNATGQVPTVVQPTRTPKLRTQR
ncbi:hypothetical protein [Tahibacter amnicola]|uniref:Heavy-metal resistance protein CzcE n=1 Tax=Tahibacter amnicola TaxID=2976241 RepID=A0ABY6BBY3_9GAMM|nr:hypothetical protein [Tahibacter amnicola]UXI67072.1 hypothetical protein N4264_20310 [Tahibacter amnicola]